MLKRTDAANIKEPCRSYLQVGNNEIFELFQSAYSGAPYDPDANTQEEDYIDIYSVDLNGRRVKCNETEKITRRPDTKNQLEVAIDYINRTMNTLNIKKLKNVWPDLLPENLLLGSVIDRNSIWSSSGWKEQRKYLNISVGLSDFPAMQIQESLGNRF